MKRLSALILSFIFLALISGPTVTVMAVDDDVGLFEVLTTVEHDNAEVFIHSTSCILSGGLELKLPTSAWTATYDNVLTIDMLTGSSKELITADDSHSMIKPQQSPLNTRFVAQHTHMGLHRLSLGEI